MRTVAFGRLTKNARNFSRERRRRSATLPGRLDTAISKTDFARSTAMSVSLGMVDSSLFVNPAVTLAHRCCESHRRSTSHHWIRPDQQMQIEAVSSKEAELLRMS